MADDIELITDEILESYKPTGERLEAPTSNGIKVPPKNRAKEKLYLLIEDPEDTAVLTRIREIADDNMGTQEVILVLKEGEEKRPLRMPFRVEVTSEMIKKLQNLLGEERVKTK